MDENVLRCVGEKGCNGKIRAKGMCGRCYGRLHGRNRRRKEGRLTREELAERPTLERCTVFLPAKGAARWAKLTPKQRRDLILPLLK